MNILLAPDVYVNASVALGSAPDQVVQRVLGKKSGTSKTTEWVLARVRSMLSALPEFKGEAVEAQVKLIRGMVEVLDSGENHDAGAWEQALVSAAHAAGATRVVTDHPDLLALENSGGIEFLSTEAWLVEAMMPPPPP